MPKSEPEQKKSAPPASPEPTDAPAAEKPAKKFVPPKWAIFAAVLLVQIAGSYYLQKALIFSHPAGATEVKSEEPKEPPKEEAKEASVVMLDEFVVNPAETAGRRFLAVKIGLETTALESDKLFESKAPLIRDAVISLLASKPFEQLANVQYRDTLKDEVKVIVNEQFADDPVSRVLFTGYVLQ
ncbi:MAG: flagellar basal body-associated FliL family protein [bacterium]|nr:flagellar basal body-associated FliL family protein [bacterium]